VVVRRRRSEGFAVAVSVLGVLLLTGVAATALRSAERATDQARLDGATASFGSVLETQLDRLSGAGTDVGVAVSLIDELDSARYAELMELLAVDERFSGVYGVALVEQVDRERLASFVADRQRDEPAFAITDDGGEPLVRIVSHHYPLPANAAAIGIDLSTRVESRTAADLALESGRPVLSDATVVEQLRPDEPGVIIHAPIPARVDRPPATIGMVLSGQRFVAALDPRPDDVAMLVTDPDATAFTQLAAIGDHDADHALTATATVEAAGNTWTLATSPEPGFSMPWYQRGSSALALGGLLASVFLGLFVRSLASGERVATDLVEQRTAELSTLNDRLADTNIALATSNRTKDAFLASVSHELRTPLTVIAGCVEAMRRLPPGGADRGAFIEPIERNVRRLDALVSDLLTVTSLDAHAVTAFRRPVDLAQVLPELPATLAGVKRAVAVSVEPGSVVEVDPRHLERILVNLLVNAERHGQPPITLSATGAGDTHVEVRVRDHGHGIPTEELGRLFQRFTRGDDRGNVPGTGLGLSIVRELAELNGGSVTYEAGDPGACFVLRLRRAT